MAAPSRFLALVTRNQLAEMFAPTYARARNIDPNEAYTRLEVALRDLRLIEGLQQAAWRGLRTRKPALDDGAILDVVSTKLAKRRQYKPVPSGRSSEGAIAALIVLVDLAAGVGSGESYDLIESPEGELLLARGFELTGGHLAGELLR